MSSVQRAFAQKLSKQQESDVRKNVASQHLIAKSEKSSVCSSSISLTELVEPLDYEEFLAQHSNILSRVPLRCILDFPANDVTVKTLPRKVRTVQHVMPNEIISKLLLHVQECVHCFTRPWKVVEFSQRHYSSSCCTRELFDKDAISPNNCPPEFEIDKDFGSFDDTLTDKSDSCTPSSRQSIASLSLVSSCTDTLAPRGSWARFDLRRSVNDPLIPNLLDDLPSEIIDQSNESRLQDNRKEAHFNLYPGADPEDSIEKRFPPTVPYEHQGYRLLAKCLQLRLELEVEPIHASMAIYDAREKKKIIENFYFDMNSENFKRMLTSHVPYSDVSMQSRSGIFEISHPSNDLFLVIRLDKVLQGDVKDSVEPYLKDDKDKYRDKTKWNAADFCDRLGKYRMPFAWTDVYLTSVFKGDNKDEKDRDSLGAAFSSNSLDRKSSTSSFDQLRRKASDMGTLTRRGSLERRSEKRRSWSPDEFAQSVENLTPASITISSFFKQESDKMKDEDIYKFLPDLKHPRTVVKKCKCIPGSIKLELSPCPEKVKYALTPELAKVNPYLDDKTRPVKEILEFPSSAIYNPHCTYRNLLFASPKELNLSVRAGSARNIGVRVQLISGESQNNVLNAIIAKSPCPEYTTKAFTAVIYHKNPTFYNEIKIALAANLTQSNHLLFTLIHVSCQKKPQEVQPSVETPDGYAWSPILQDGKLKVGEFSLPVMVETPPENYSFIPPNIHLPDIKRLDNHRPVFSVTIDAVASVHTLDEKLLHNPTLKHSKH